MVDRKKLLLRLDPQVHAGLKRWADDEFRSVNSQIEYLLRNSLSKAGRLPVTGGEPALIDDSKGDG